MRYCPKLPHFSFVHNIKTCVWLCVAHNKLQSNCTRYMLVKNFHISLAKEFLLGQNSYNKSLAYDIWVNNGVIVGQGVIMVDECLWCWWSRWGCTWKYIRADVSAILRATGKNKSADYVLRYASCNGNAEFAGFFWPGRVYEP